MLLIYTHMKVTLQSKWRERLWNPRWSFFVCEKCLTTYYFTLLTISNSSRIWCHNLVCLFRKQRKRKVRPTELFISQRKEKNVLKLEFAWWWLWRFSSNTVAQCFTLSYDSCSSSPPFSDDTPDLMPDSSTFIYFIWKIKRKKLEMKLSY